MLNDICYWLDLKKGSRILWLSDKQEIKTSGSPEDIIVVHKTYEEFSINEENLFDLCFCDLPVKLKNGYKEALKRVFENFEGEQVLVWGMTSGVWSHSLITRVLGFRFPHYSKLYSFKKNEIVGNLGNWKIKNQLFVYPHKVGGFLLSDSMVFLYNLRVWFTNSKRMRMVGLFLKHKYPVKKLQKNWPLQILIYARIPN